MPRTMTRRAPDTQAGAFTLRLAVGLYRELPKGPGNLSFSPFGIASLLVTAQAGAAGATRTDIETVLGRPGAGETLAEQAGELTRDLQALAKGNHRELHLSVASALWAQAGYPIHPSFVECLRTTLGAEAKEVDFAEGRSEGVRSINAWVAEATGQRITTILSESDVDSLTRGVLTNAVYLGAAWLQSFEPGLTRLRLFHLPDGTSVDVPTMSLEWSFGHGREDGLQALQLHYANPRLSMLIVLPDPGRLEQVERDLDPPRLTRIVEEMKKRDIRVFLPRFRVESSFPLRSALERVGLRRAFAPDADFSGVSSESGFRVSQMLHRTFMNVDEFGTEAAAATAMVWMGAIPDPTLEFRVDRPFLFLIRDAGTGTILFFGRVVDPRPA